MPVGSEAVGHISGATVPLDELKPHFLKPIVIRGAPNHSYDCQRLDLLHYFTEVYRSVYLSKHWQKAACLGWLYYVAYGEALIQKVEDEELSIFSGSRSNPDHRAILDRSARREYVKNALSQSHEHLQKHLTQNIATFLLTHQDQTLRIALIKYLTEHPLKKVAPKL